MPAEALQAPRSVAGLLMMQMTTRPPVGPLQAPQRPWRHRGVLPERRDTRVWAARGNRSLGPSMSSTTEDT